MAKKKSKKKDKKTTTTDVDKNVDKKKGTDIEKYVIIGLVLALIIVLGYAIVNIDMFLPKTQEKDTGEIVASVNGVNIYSKDIDKAYQYLQAQFGPQVTREFVINNSITQEILSQEAVKNEIYVDRKEVIDGVDRWLLDLKEQMSQEQLAMVLEDRNMTYEEFRNDTIEMYYNDLVVFSLLNKTIFSDIDESKYYDSEITEKDIEDFYNENKDYFYMVNASHILVCYQGSQSCTQDRTKEQALERINEVYEKLKSNGNFEELAMEYSDCPSAAEGGNLGFFGKGEMAPEFEEAAFALKHENQLSEPVETSFGYHIIKLNAKKTEFDDFKNEINIQIQLIRQQEAQQEIRLIQEEKLKAYIKELRSKADIRYFAANPQAGAGISIKPTIQTFSAKEGDICTENGKPVIRMFSTTTCSHCSWIKDTFDGLVKEYAADGKIAAYHWELDTEDNTLTSAKESYMPEEEKSVYLSFNPRSSVPTFVFGCKYYRIGNGYESESDLAAEKREFIAVIEELLKETGANSQ